MSPLLKIK